MADVDVSIYDGITVAESVSGIPSDCILSTYDEATVADVVTVLGELHVNTFDSTSLTGSVSSDIHFPINTYEVVTITESAIPNILFHWRSGQPYEEVYAPTAVCEAEFAAAFSVNVTAPMAVGAGQFGLQADTTAPTAEGESTLSAEFDGYFSVDVVGPTAEVSGQMGSLMEATSPAFTGEATMYGSSFIVDATGPTATGEAEFTDIMYLSVDVVGPVGLSIGLMYETGGFVVDVVASATVCIGSLKEDSIFSVDATAPTAYIGFKEAMLNENYWYVDAVAPVGVMQGNDGGKPGSMYRADRFSNYILQYERWPSAV